MNKAPSGDVLINRATYRKAGRLVYALLVSTSFRTATERELYRLLDVKESSAAIMLCTFCLRNQGCRN